MGIPTPPKRTPFPDIDQVHLDFKLEDYVRSMGIQQAFNMYQYKGMQVQQSACPQAFFRLHPLLDCLLDVSPTGQLKYRCLKQSLEGIAQIFGWEVLSPHWDLDPAHLCGRCADSIGTLMNHWRRATASPTSWSKFCEKLDKSQAQCLERLYKKTGAKKRALKANLSEVTMDSNGYPQMLATPSEEGPMESDESGHDEDDAESKQGSLEVEGSWEASALECSPPPVAKVAWRTAAGKIPKKAICKPRSNNEEANH